MSLVFEIDEYPEYHTEFHSRLFTDTWSEYFAAGAQARIPLETFRNLYENNPAGTPVLALARKGDTWAGAVAAIPFRMLDERNGGFMAYQISDIMVAPAYRRRGIFSRLLKLLTDHLARSSRSVVFVFPNRRSAPGAINCGYRSAGVLPTVIGIPGPAFTFCRLDANGKVYRKFGQPWARYREVDREEAARIIGGRDTVLPRLVRDGDYLKWRYFQPPGEEKFQFWAIEPVAAGEAFIAVTTRHRYGKREFTVFLETLPQDGGDQRTLAAALLLALGRKQGAGLLYTNETIRGGLLSPAWGLSLPHRLNPRPIELLIYPRPGNSELEKNFLRARFTTADWLGFL